jgi:hypothetical protein
MTPGGVTLLLPLPRVWDGRFIFPIGLLLALVVSSALIVFAVSHSPPACDEALVAQPLPPDWNKWRELRSTAGFRLVPGKRREAPRDNLAFVVEDGVCPGEGAAIDARWLDAANRPSPVLRFRESPFGSAFVIAAQNGSACPAPTGEGCETAVVAFRTAVAPEVQGLKLIVVSPRETLVLVAMHLAVATVIAWGIVRAARNRRFARELLDPGRFVEATGREDGTLSLDANAGVVCEVGRQSRFRGPVLVRLSRSHGGGYRTPPTVRVEEVVRGGRAQASQRAMGRASMLLNGLTALAVSAAIVGSFCGLNAWVLIGYEDTVIRHRHDQQRYEVHMRAGP